MELTCPAQGHNSVQPVRIEPKSEDLSDALPLRQRAPVLRSYLQPLSLEFAV